VAHPPVIHRFAFPTAAGDVEAILDFGTWRCDDVRLRELLERFAHEPEPWRLDHLIAEVRELGGHHVASFWPSPSTRFECVRCGASCTQHRDGCIGWHEDERSFDRCEELDAQGKPWECSHYRAGEERAFEAQVAECRQRAGLDAKAIAEAARPESRSRKSSET
jgi:hypothetical protein